MKDLDINRFLRSGVKSKSKIYKRIIYWFCKHYFYCDIHPTSNLSMNVQFAHNGLGVVINEQTVIEENVIIQHHVTVGSNGKGAAHICRGVYIGAHAIIIGKINIGENVVIGAGAVVTKSIPPNVTVAGNPAQIINNNSER